MDIIISFILVVIAVTVFLQKPIKIEVKHSYEQPPVIVPQQLTDKEVAEDDVNKNSLDSVMTALHDIMGVSKDEHNG